MMIAESMLSKRRVLRFTVAYFSTLSYFRPILPVCMIVMSERQLLRAGNSGHELIPTPK